MGYFLEDKGNSIIKFLRKRFPLNPNSIDRIKRCNLFFLNEIVYSHYEIDPFIKISIERFAKSWDPHFIVDLLRRDALLDKIKLRPVTNFRECIEKDEYCRWAIKKNLPLPEFLLEELLPYQPQIFKKTKDVSSIDWNKLPNPILAALGANALAQAAKRVNQQVKISEIYRSKSVQTFLQNLAKIEKKELRAEDTFREYVEQQF